MADPAYIVDGVLTDGDAWVAIASTTLTSDTATVTFTSTDDGQTGDFSQYMDLVAIYYCSTAGTGTSVPSSFYTTVNGDTSSVYDYQLVYGGGSSPSMGAAAYVSQSSWNIGDMPSNGDSTNEMGVAILYLQDINSGKWKAGNVVAEAEGAAYGYMRMNGLIYKSPSPITSITFDGSGDIRDTSSFDLFGILPRMVGMVGA